MLERRYGGQPGDAADFARAREPVARQAVAAALYRRSAFAHERGELGAGCELESGSVAQTAPHQASAVVWCQLVEQVPSGASVVDSYLREPGRICLGLPR